MIFFLWPNDKICAFYCCQSLLNFVFLSFHILTKSTLLKCYNKKFLRFLPENDWWFSYSFSHDRKKKFTILSLLMRDEFLGFFSEIVSCSILWFYSTIDWHNTRFFCRFSNEKFCIFYFLYTNIFRDIFATTDWQVFWHFLMINWWISLYFPYNQVMKVRIFFLDRVIIRSNWYVRNN